MDELTGQPPPRLPWAVRKFGIEFYTITIPRLVLAVIAAMVFLTLSAPDLWAMAQVMGNGSLALFINFVIMRAIVNLIVLPVFLVIPWLVLHLLGLRLPWHLIALSILFLLPRLLAMPLGNFGYPSFVYILFKVISFGGTALIFWRLAYRRADTQFDPGVFA